MSLRDALWTTGLILTLVAVGLMVARVITGPAPTLTEVALTAGLLLLASRDAR